jgi:thioredoxin reductase (NADPH)
MSADWEVAVVGGGPAGLTAAFLAARHGRSTFLLDPLGAGGAIVNLGQIEDFPGFPDGVSGFELGPRLQSQALDAGVAFELGEARRIEPRGTDWAVVTDERELTAGAVIVATGLRPRALGVPGEDELAGKGFSHCATCDGPLYQGQAVVVCGGDDVALIEALELVRQDVRVVLLHPGEALGGQETYRRRVAESPQVEVRQQTVLEEILGDGVVDGVRVRSLASGETSTLPAAGVFAYVGQDPNTECIAGVVALAEGGHLPTDVWMRTGRPGLFAAGDIRVDSAGNAVSAAGDGATAAIAAHRYLAERAP